MESLRNVLEIFYFAAAPLLLLILVLWVKQLKTSGQNHTMQCQHQAAALTERQCQRYVDTIVPLFDKLKQVFKDYELPTYKGEISSFTQECLLDMAEDWSPECYQGFNDNLETVLENLNTLESFAIYFTKGLADEEIAFTYVGLSYCKLVEDLYPYLSAVREMKKINYFNHIVELYRLWSDRIASSNLKNIVDPFHSG